LTAQGQTTGNHKNSVPFSDAESGDPAELHTSPKMAARAHGPGEPALASQKHYHRKAFEYISKALKIDEENDGTLEALQDHRILHQKLGLDFVSIYFWRELLILIYK
jgi:hypothetical protein